MTDEYFIHNLVMYVNNYATIDHNHVHFNLTETKLDNIDIYTQ